MRTTLPSCFALAALAACGPKDANGDGIADGVRDPTQVTLVAPSSPIGALTGQVLNTRLAPLSDVSVSVTPGGLKAATDGEGNFAFDKLPGGAKVLVTLSKPGFATVRTSATIPGEA